VRRSALEGLVFAALMGALILVSGFFS